MELQEVTENCPVDEVIGNSIIKAWKKINSPLYSNIVCTVSGGSDSDIVVDICTKCDSDKKIDYVWFDTGLEYQATKDHLKYLEEKYHIKIKPFKAIKPIPVSCREYGQPFISKRVSGYISRLQKHHFRWEDKPFEELITQYCTWDESRKNWIGCKSALRWWCNDWGDKSQINISNNPWLKEFLIEYPPDNFGIKISDECCKYAKKDVLHKLIAENGYDLNISGIRKAEGGQRSTTYTCCFTEDDDGCDLYMPIFFYKKRNKETYASHYNIKNSDCYTKYGLPRTGCAGCPFGRNFEEELEAMKKYEPQLYVAVNSIFAQSYAYTRLYREFCKRKNEDKKNDNQIPGQYSLDYYEGVVPEN